MEKTVSRKERNRMLAREHSLEFVRLFRKNKAAMLGLAILTVFVLAAVFADLIVPYELGIRQSSADRLLAPCAGHIFGTDKFGRDIFARIVHGARRSLSLGLGTTLISVTIGGLIGAFCGFLGGKFDLIVMRLCDVMMCIPALLFALAVVAVLGSNMLNLIIAVTLITIPSYIRIIRSVILSIVEQDYIYAARLSGSSTIKTVFRHVLPNAMGPIIVQASMNVASMMLTAASLSFIGMGIQPPTPEWGGMLDQAREYMLLKPHMLLFPGAAICLAALSLNLVGDGLRDALDPRLRS
ncbi:MAG: ABC transporter permease [Lachnospiraceae bacterium]|nr:ABC transporter permease [Lachnospiraceae bacterium]